MAAISTCLNGMKTRIAGLNFQRTVHLNIISIVKPTRCTNVSNLFYFGMTLHVSGSLSIHHQEFKAVHRATKQILLSSFLASRQQYLFDICLLLYLQSRTPDDRRKCRPKHVVSFQNKINLIHWCI